MNSFVSCFLVHTPDKIHYILKLSKTFSFWMFPGPAQRKQIDNIGQIFSGFLSTCFLGPNPSNIWMFDKWKQHCCQVFCVPFSGEISAKQTKTAVLCRPISHDQPSKKKLYIYILYISIILYYIILYYIILYYVYIHYILLCYIYIYVCV